MSGSSISSLVIFKDTTKTLWKTQFYYILGGILVSLKRSKSPKDQKESRLLDSTDYISAATSKTWSWPSGVYQYSSVPMLSKTRWALKNCTGKPSYRLRLSCTDCKIQTTTAQKPAGPASHDILTHLSEGDAKSLQGMAWKWRADRY